MYVAVVCLSTYWVCIEAAWAYCACDKSQRAMVVATFTDIFSVGTFWFSIIVLHFVGSAQLDDGGGSGWLRGTCAEMVIGFTISVHTLIHWYCDLMPRKKSLLGASFAQSSLFSGGRDEKIRTSTQNSKFGVTTNIKCPIHTDISLSSVMCSWNRCIEQINRCIRWRLGWGLRLSSWVG